MMSFSLSTFAQLEPPHQSSPTDNPPPHVPPLLRKHKPVTSPNPPPSFPLLCNLPLCNENGKKTNKCPLNHAGLFPDMNSYITIQNSMPIPSSPMQNVYFVVQRRSQCTTTNIPLLLFCDNLMYVLTSPHINHRVWEKPPPILRFCPPANRVACFASMMCSNI